jgi:hypothetical protein
MVLAHLSAPLPRPPPPKKKKIAFGNYLHEQEKNKNEQGIKKSPTVDTFAQ